MDEMRTISQNAATQRQTPLDDRSRQRLQRATKEFEALLVGYMLKSMRSGTNTNELFGDSYGGDVLEGMFDGQMAQHISRNSSFGLAEMLYRRMTGEELPAAQTGAGTSAGASSPRPQQQVSTGTARAAVPATATPVDTLSRVVRPAVVLSAENARGSIGAVQNTTRAVSDTLRRRLDQVAPFVQEAADTHGVDPNLLKAVIAAESHGDTLARSPRNAKGLMQLIDSTAAAMGVKDVWDARDNVMGGAKYLSKLMAQFEGDQQKAVASYNAGPGAVTKHGGIPPYKETRAYVDKVMNYLRAFEQEE
jgi:Rod binding domain-containing protein